jgi:hypothetical protein
MKTRRPRRFKELRPEWCRSLKGQKVGKYTLTGYIGAGRIGYVYRASRDDYPGSVRAVKLVFDELPKGWKVELKKVAQLELVDGVAHFHDLGAETITHEDESHLCQFTVWDYIDPGENLKEYLKRVESVPTSFLVALIERIVHVLHACDAQGIHRHGDLHSGNILVGKPSAAKLDEDTLEPRAPIYVTDFGYGTTGALKLPKDDYAGLSQIINQTIAHIKYEKATATDRQTLVAIKSRLGKLLAELPGCERRAPLDILRVLKDIKRSVRAGGARAQVGQTTGDVNASAVRSETPSVGHFQVTEMIGERWEWWKRLFVPTVPARSKILALDIPTVVTGPRGCGKTMLFRRLSERLIVECGEVPEIDVLGRFVALYVNANDFADAFAHFPETPTPDQEGRLICYANLCVLAELLEVQSARTGPEERSTELLLHRLRELLVPPSYTTLVEGEDQLERYRSILEQIKWRFPTGDSDALFPGYGDLRQHRWLAKFLKEARTLCPWFEDRSVLLFIDDYSVPRVSASMQKVLNRLFLQRSPHFLAKVATEAATTFLAEDSSGKTLEDGDDFQLVDMGEESLFLPETERLAFLGNVFARRLEWDPRIPADKNSLRNLLGRLGLSKTEFARRLRLSPVEQSPEDQIEVSGTSQRRGRSRPRVLYWGEDVFAALWSGDTRTMIQVITDVVDQAAESTPTNPSRDIDLPVTPAIQDRVFRNRGGEWLSSHTRNEPTQPQLVKDALREIKKVKPQFALRGSYGDHLKAVVEAFVTAARSLLLGPTYQIQEGNSVREVPRMAFRLEIIDEFRVDGLAGEILRDLIRYGLFIRDSRGKSIRGAFVPRLFLRRLLLPYGSLALSKRDSVPLRCNQLITLLLQPDVFSAGLGVRRADHDATNQLMFAFSEDQEAVDPRYDDLDLEGNSDLPESEGNLGEDDSE